MCGYVPRPVDTRDVVLPTHLLSLIELLAENAHAHWALQRLSEGWRYGPERDDNRKLHPCLVAYADLPESEKDYDRKMAVETVKLVIALGYTLAPPTSQGRQ